MADAEDIQPLVCDNGTGMVKVHSLFLEHVAVFLVVDLLMCSIIISVFMDVISFALRLVILDRFEF